MAFFALIPAAGSGSRIAFALGDDLPKQYRLLAGKPMIQHALEAFAACEAITATYVVLAPGDQRFAALGLTRHGRPLNVGGPSRHASVLNGLRVIPADETDWILVHDAARPGLTATLIHALIRGLQDDPVGGLLALPVADTLKREAQGDRQARVTCTVSREGLWQAQTPQMFRYGILRRALQQAEEQGRTITDEASAIEATGLSPRLVTGSARNFKVTRADDMELAERILATPQR